jgi:hypothetical protein
VSRIAATFARLRVAGRAALIPFVEAFDPDRATSLALLTGMADVGADIIEIGVPFTDPMADGPTIQAAGRRALKAGATLKGVLELVREFRQANDHTPIVLMGYLNPLLNHGIATFCEDAAGAGVDGLIVVDLPTEEADLLLPAAAAHGLDVIRQDQRQPLVGLCLLCQHHRHYRHAHRVGRRPRARHPPHPPCHQPADRRRFWCAHARTGGDRRPACRWRDRRLGVDRPAGDDTFGRRCAGRCRGPGGRHARRQTGRLITTRVNPGASRIRTGWYRA